MVVTVVTNQSLLSMGLWCYILCKVRNLVLTDPPPARCGLLWLCFWAVVLAGTWPMHCLLCNPYPLPGIPIFLLASACVVHVMVGLVCARLVYNIHVGMPTYICMVTLLFFFILEGRKLLVSLEWGHSLTPWRGSIFHLHADPPLHPLEREQVVSICLPTHLSMRPFMHPIIRSLLYQPISLCYIHIVLRQWGRPDQELVQVQSYHALWL